MRKFLAATAIALTLATTQAYAGNDKVLKVDSFEGGFEIYTLWGNYCAMASVDAGANFIFSNAVAAKANNWDIFLYRAVDVGWGATSEGGNTCVQLFVQ